VITVYLQGNHRPLKADGPKLLKLWSKTDPICLLRQCLVNKMRSRHWRGAANAKKKWMEVCHAMLEVDGKPVSGPAVVVIEQAIPGNCDTDAAVKAILDGIQHCVFESGDDRSMGPLVVVPRKPTRKGLKPYVKVMVASIADEPAVAQQLVAEGLLLAHEDYYGERQGSFFKDNV